MQLGPHLGLHSSSVLDEKPGRVVLQTQIHLQVIAMAEADRGGPLQDDFMRWRFRPRHWMIALPRIDDLILIVCAFETKSFLRVWTFLLFLFSI